MKMFHYLTLFTMFLPAIVQASPFINGEHVDEIKVVSYFAEWCKPCRKEVHILNKVSQQEVNVAGVNFEQDDDSHTQKVISELGIEYPVYKQGKHNTPLPPVLPTTYILSQGQVVQTLYGKQSYTDIMQAIKFNDKGF
ncbi:TlpA family protein disulfide reductase [Vibrio sp. Isolate25]|uniref:TlpA family protein disulfide reductase n=1 Tax=Vibrio sp. Isolate25 TaxID=2908535 RepID=UPI001EFDD653|nr:TlpA disulfide reductase family protein [Vibrio sp. Isolate25]MCG9599319.1 TlpA family protein disulfide reductase [Vibrio sp. Isolate25]